MEYKLLIIDDDPDVLASLSDLLEDEGFNVRTATCGEEALEMFSDFNPSVVISDMQMSGMTGLEFLQEIRKINAYVQIIILTGYASVKNVSDAMAHNGAFAYFQKPIMEFDIFFATIRQAFEKERLIIENNLWEDRLKTVNTRFETIFENMDAVIYVADMNTYDIIYANSKFKTMFGDYNDGDRRCWEMLQKDGTGPCPFCTNSKLIDQHGKPLSPYTWEFFHPTVRRWFSIKDQGIYWHDGRVVKLQTAMDITQYYKLSRELENSKRFKAIGVLAGGIAHDINNALAAILGNINMIQLIVDDSDTNEYCKEAENGVMLAKTLAGKLLEFVRGDAPVKKHINMKELLNEFILENQFTSKVVFSIADESTHYNIDADAEQIKTVLYNICMNASESMNLKGTIGVDLKRSYNTMKNCDYVVISIHDDGTGISLSNLEKVFDPYFTTKFQGEQKGTGMGLSTAYSIIKRHGGYIDIDSVEGKGTQVDVCLPTISV
ncbi:MAG: response regulator [Desulfamplus sp.]|nr:response regulator [Desulfamplus sp.]